MDLRLEEPQAPNWSFGGFHYPYDLVVSTYQEYTEHGVMLVPGGYLDQPPEWWDDIRTYRALYNTLYLETLPDAEAKWKKDRGE